MVTEAQVSQGERLCPWCGSAATHWVPRGYTGPTDEIHQYYTCADCGKTTYERVAKTAREMRLGRYRPGDIYQDRANQTRYHVTRILKVGANEFLIYLRPLTKHDSAVPAS